MKLQVLPMALAFVASSTIAGAPTPIVPRTPSVIVQGGLNEVSPSKVVGWACLHDTAANPNPGFGRQLAILKLYIDGVFVEQTSSGRYRPDVKNAGACNGQNNFAGFHFHNIPVLDPNRLHTFEVRELDRTLDPLPQNEKPITAPITKSFATGLDGWVEIKSVTPTAQGATVTVAGWACDTTAPAPYTPTIRIYDSSKSWKIDFVTSTARPDTKIAGCKPSPTGQYPYGYVYTANLTRAANPGFFDGLRKDYLVYGVDYKGVERPLAFDASRVPTQLGFGRANPAATRIGHLIVLPQTSLAAYQMELKTVFTALNNGDTKSKSQILLASAQQLETIDAESPDYPAKLANYHVEAMKLAASNNHTVSLENARIFFHYSGSACCGTIRADWRDRLRKYMAPLLAAGVAAQVDYFYPVDEPFWATPHNQAEFLPLAETLVAIRTEIRKSIPNAKTMTTMGWPTYTPGDVNLFPAKPVWDNVAKAFDMITGDYYPIESAVPDDIMQACQGASVGFQPDDDMATRAALCQIDKLKQVLPNTPIMLISQGELYCVSNNGAPCQFGVNTNEKPHSIEENVRRLKRYNATLYSLVNQDTSGRMRGVANFLFHGVSDGLIIPSDGLDQYLAQSGSSTQSMGSFFTTLGYCASQPTLFGYQAVTGNFSCNAGVSALKK
jgi:hypothetical protein